MLQEEEVKLMELLRGQRVLAISLLVDEVPYAGLLPFAVTEDLRAVIIHASKLSRHTRGLAAGGPYGALVHEQDQPSANPFQLARLSLQGTIDVIEKDSERYKEMKELFLRKFPQGEPMFRLGDFDLYSLGIERARYVAGFARTFNVSAHQLGEIAKQA